MSAPDQDKDSWAIWDMAEEPNHPLELICAILIGMIFFAMVLLFAHIWMSTGPNCPGKDPKWLGWCVDATPQKPNPTSIGSDWQWMEQEDQR